jgi:hypothetical protein
MNPGGGEGRKHTEKATTKFSPALYEKSNPIQVSEGEGVSRCIHPLLMVPVQQVTHNLKFTILTGFLSLDCDVYFNYAQKKITTY